MTERLRVEITASARRQIEELRAYIIGQGAPVAAERFVDKLVNRINSLATSPYRGRPARSGHREISVPPYIVRYRIAVDAVYVIRVRHSARRPD